MRREVWRAADGTLGRLIDGVTDWALAMFAGWVVLAYLAMVAHAPVQPFLIGWLVLAVPVAVALRWLRRTPDPAPADAVGPADDRRRLLLGLGAPFALVAVAALLSAHAYGVRWAVVWVLGVVAVSFALAVELVPRARAFAAPATSRAPASPIGANLFVFAVAVASGVVAMFVFRPDDDDVYYLNRAASVADFDRIPIRDMILTHGHLTAVAGTGAPVDALAPMQGAIARLIGAHAATIAYVATPFVATILAVFALWRLIRCWAPRRAIAAFIVAIVFLYYDGNTHYSFGNFFLTRMWQGKVVFVAWLVPLLLAYLTDWARRPDRRMGVLLVAAGVASIGLTVSATYDFPLLVAAGLLPLVAARRWRVAILPAAAALAPLVIGGIASRMSPPAGLQLSNLGGAPTTFHDIVGVGALAAICAVALWFGNRLPRDRDARLIALGTSIIVTVALTPGLLHGLGDAIGVGGALRRIVWIAPVPALLGLVATVPVPELVNRRVNLLRPAAALAITAVLAGGVAAVGAPILSYEGTKVFSHPTWKTDATVRAEAQRVLARVPPGAEVLAPMGIMRAIAILTAKVHAVDPRTYYTLLIKQPKQMLVARITLKHFVLKTPSGVPGYRVVGALKELAVTDACLPYTYAGQAHVLQAAGYVFAFSTAQLNCYRLASSSA